LRVAVQVDGSTVGEATYRSDNGYHVYGLNTTGLPENRDRQLQVVVRDGDGGVATSAVTVTVDNRSPASLRTWARFPVNTTVGDPVTTNVTVRNLGEETGTRELALLVDGERSDARTLQLAGGASVELSFATTFETAGNHTLSVGRNATTLAVSSGVNDTDGNATDDPSLPEGSTRFDGDENGRIEVGEVLVAIAAFSEGGSVAGEPVGIGDVLAAIAAYNSQTPPTGA
jgi:hypothetical protein